MHALKDFFTTDYGILSAIVIFLVICMAVWYVRFFLVNIERDTQNALKAQKEARKAQKAAAAAAAAAAAVAAEAPAQAQAQA